MTDIVERLRYHAEDGGLEIGAAWSLLDESADEIERLRDRVRELEQAAQELREAEPFGYLDMSSNDDPRQCSYFTTGPVTDHPGWIPLYRHPTRK